MPLAVIELNNSADENTTVWSAFSQFETDKAQIPSLFRFNEVMVISDGMEARAGTITSNKEWFMLWRTINGEEISPDTKSKSMEVLLRGMFGRNVFFFFAFFNDYNVSIVSQFFEKSNVYAVIETRHVVSLRCENSHEIHTKMKFKSAKV